MLSQNTHVVGTLRSNSKYIPNEVKNTSLALGEIVAKEAQVEGISVLKWKDKRDVMISTTLHKGIDTETKINFFGREATKLT